jgi:hypothetical protein
MNAAIQSTILNSSSAFRRWKGFNGKISSRDFQDGLKQDSKLNLCVQEIEKIFLHEVSLTDFIKVFGSVERRSNITRKMTPDDEAIQEIASQIKDPSW